MDLKKFEEAISYVEEAKSRLLFVKQLLEPKRVRREVKEKVREELVTALYRLHRAHSILKEIFEQNYEGVYSTGASQGVEWE